MNLDDLKRELIGLEPDMPVEHVLDLREKIIATASRMREIRDDLESRLIDWIDHNGEIVIAEGRRLYVGEKTTTRVRDKAAALAALVEAVGGDVEQLASYLSSDPIKHGAARTVLGESWSDHFIREKSEGLKTTRVVKQTQP